MSLFAVTVWTCELVVNIYGGRALFGKRRSNAELRGFWKLGLTVVAAALCPLIAGSEVFVTEQHVLVRVISRETNGGSSELVTLQEESFDLFESFTENLSLTTVNDGATLNSNALVHYTVSPTPTLLTVGGSVEMGTHITATSILEVGFSIQDEATPFKLEGTLTGTAPANGQATVIFGLRGANGFSEEIGCEPGDASSICGTPVPVSFERLLEPGDYFIDVQPEAFGDIVSVGTLTASWSVQVGEPSCDLTWKVSNGNMGDASSWMPERVPEDSGSGCDNLIFDPSDALELVTFGTVAANSLRVTGALPTLTGQSLTLSGLGGKDGLAIGAKGTLFLTGGTINLPQDGRIVVGTSGGAAGDVSSLIVTGQNAAVTQSLASQVLVGAAEEGLLSITSGGALDGGGVKVGTSAKGTLTVEGIEGSARSSLGLGGDVRVGDGGEGILNVLDGAFLGTLGDLVVGPVNSGLVTISGFDTVNARPAALDAENIRIGGSEAGENVVSVLAGGLLTGNVLTVGDGAGPGSLFLVASDEENAEQPIVAVLTDTFIGEESAGLLRMERDAQLVIGDSNETARLRIASDGEGTGTVELAGALDQLSTITVHGSLDIGLTAAAAIDVKTGFVDATGGMRYGRGTIAVQSDPADDFRSRLVVDQTAEIVGPGDGSDTTITLTSGAKFEVKDALFFSNGRITASGNLNPFVIDPNDPLIDSASLVKVFGELVVGDFEGVVQGDARLRLQNGGIADVGVLRMRSGEITVITPDASARASELLSFDSITVGNALTISSRIATLRVLGASRVAAPGGLVVSATGRVFFSRSATLPRPRVEAGGRVTRLRNGAVQKGFAPAIFEGGLDLEDDGVLEIEADAGAEPNVLVDGDANLLGDLEVTFPDEANLQAGAAFNLFEITGAKNGNFGEIRFPSRSDDFEGTTAFEDGVLTLTVVVPGTAVLNPVANDINGDNAVNAVDVQLAINAALGIGIGPLSGDVNNDGSANAVDVQLVINAALGLSR